MTDALIRELLKEVRAEHQERKRQFDTIERRLTVLESRVEDCTVAVSTLAGEIQAVRQLAGEEGASIRKQLRLVSDFAGMTDPHKGNGNGGE